MKMTLATLLALLFIGGGCSYKYDAQWNDQDKTGMEPASSSAASGTVLTGSCIAEGERPVDGATCCAGLEEVALDHAFSVCAKAGTPSYKPKVCMAEGETPFIDTPNCCAGLEPKEEGNKYVCRKLI